MFKVLMGQKFMVLICMFPQWMANLGTSQAGFVLAKECIDCLSLHWCMSSEIPSAWGAHKGTKKVENDFLMYKDWPPLSGKRCLCFLLALSPAENSFPEGLCFHFSLAMEKVGSNKIGSENPAARQGSTWGGKVENAVLLLCHKYSRFQWRLQRFQYRLLSNSHTARLLGRAFGVQFMCQPHLGAEVQCSTWACWCWASQLAPEGVGLDWDPRRLYWLCLRCTCTLRLKKWLGRGVRSLCSEISYSWMYFSAILDKYAVVNAYLACVCGYWLSIAVERKRKHRQNAEFLDVWAMLFLGTFDLCFHLRNII